MAKKLKYNKKKEKQFKIIIGIILILVAILIVVISYKKASDSAKEDENNRNQNSSGVATLKYHAKDYDSLESLLKSKDCKLINQNETEEGLVANVSFSVGLYTDNKSNENYFVNICKLVAEFLDYENFELKDTSKDIDIKVKCEKPNIVELKINDDTNYYLNHDSNNNKNLSTNITNFIIQSQQLNQLINGNWDETKVNWGTKDSTCNGYNIYFDEGIRYKVVAKNVYNVIFTTKYNGQIAGGLNASSSPDAVKSALGNPTFSDNDNLYGYLGENNYLFFDFLNKEVSVYPVVKISEDDENSLKNLVEEMNKSNDIKNFAIELTDLWDDYDVYDYDSNYVDLRYTLKGVNLSISSSSLKNGLYIYQNYSGNRNIADLDNVYVTNSDFVFENEKQDIINNNLNRKLEGEYSDSELARIGSKFYVRFRTSDPFKKEYTGPQFYSSDESYPDTELDRTLTVSSYIWYDDYNFIYSVNNDGIYVYNCINYQNQKLADIDEEITINSAQNGEINYNDNQILKINAS